VGSNREERRGEGEVPYTARKVTATAGEGPSINGSNDPLVVSGAVLSAYVEEWLEVWRGDRPINMAEVGTSWSRQQSATISGGGRQPTPYMGGLEYISQHTEPRLATRSIHRAISGESKWVSFNVADRIVTAMGWEHIWQDGLRPVPNPGWSRERWARWNALNGGCSDF
jgi:hypothetical protein